MLSNTSLSREARIQDERGHQGVSSGPYRIVRHPLYLLTILLWLTTPLMLGSWLAFVPSVMAGALMALRTALEDRILLADLAGYAVYARRVRYRLLPGFW
jgi:protein-S-isoprenylcysteine O-methyltransferase Ste14